MEDLPPGIEPWAPVNSPWPPGSQGAPGSPPDLEHQQQIRPLGAESQFPSPRTDHFKRASVGRCHLQTANDRFGPGARDAVRRRERPPGTFPAGNDETPFTWPGQGTSSADLAKDEASKSIYSRVPSMACNRNNLTALSQTYNFYFVAYQGRVFVYRPRTVPAQVLPRKPDLQIVPSKSMADIQIGGPGFVGHVMDARRPHCINHIVAGFLGKEEIVVAAYDDGDVVAYYLKDVLQAVLLDADSPGAIVPCLEDEPFFHENMGSTVWGLAIHQKSRLIAMSTNRHEVTVWAFALSKPESKPKNDMGGNRDGFEHRVRQRARNWRIVISLGEEADNIPNLTFLDDEHGHAEKICAIDVGGHTWLADIWRAFQPATRIKALRCEQLRSEEFFPQNSRGWGIAALPETSFMSVRTIEELIGTYPDDMHIKDAGSSCQQPMAFLRTPLHEIPNDPIHTVRAHTTPGRIHPRPVPPPPFTEVPAVLPTTAPVPDVANNANDLLQNAFDGWSADEDEDFEDGDMEPDLADLGFESVMDDGESESLEDEDGAGVPSEVANFMAGLIGQGGQGIQPGPNGIPTHQGTLSINIWGTLSLNVSGTGYPETLLYSGPINGGNWKSMIRDRREYPVLRHRSLALQEEGPDSFLGQLDMVYFPHNGRVQEMPRTARTMGWFLKRQIESNTNKANSGFGRPLKRYQLIRGYEKDLEMRSLCEQSKSNPEIGIVSPDALVFGGFREAALGRHFRATSRMSMVHHIPELSMLVVGSPTGRVLLITLTRLPVPYRDDHVGGMWDHGFRVDWVLPLKSDEIAYRKDMRPLYGMAIAPVQTEPFVSDPCEEEKVGMPRRFRLMLHYRTHDILTYEISREAQTGKLCIF